MLELALTSFLDFIFINSPLWLLLYITIKQCLLTDKHYCDKLKNKFLCHIDVFFIALLCI